MKIDLDKERDNMSNRERAIDIINALPEYKMPYIVMLLQGMRFDDDIEDDIFCESLYQRYLDDPDPSKDEGYSLDECNKEWGINI